MTAQLNSPLRYPGSKAGLVEWAERFLTETGRRGVQFVETYAGSAALSLNLLAKNVVTSVMLFERDPLLFSFWYCVFFRTDELIRLIDKFEVSLATRDELSWLRDLDYVCDDIVLMGYAGLMFNRTSFSGVLHAGPIGGVDQKSRYKVDCRFNKVELVRRIRQLSEFRDRVSVFFGDALTALKDANNADNQSRVFYVDPPYYVQGRRLYRYSYGFSDHVELAEVLAAAEFDWVLSYDDHPAIRHFYRAFALYEPVVRYSSKVPKNETELVYANFGNKCSDMRPLGLMMSADITDGSTGKIWAVAAA
jgi:DNA adenine methylase